MTEPDFQLSRNVFGKLIFIGPDGCPHEGVVPVRAFPIAAPDQGIAIIDPQGHELTWIDSLGDLSDELQTLIQSELNSRDFMPEIKRIIGVSSFATPCNWQVETDRGLTTFILKGEENIRRLTPPSLLVTESHGIHFLIRDRFGLDHHSRKILDRFL
jgi:Domain of unknown function (DUF1854)